ncbi:formimidoylglutamase [Metabacillus sp. KIGAM252]|uniref:Formimidoylglutamase n=1 Tax=Metabacillus flavus TaxID=2823519 RepID=A0ABS5LEP2_9BACI|nr:formimidoylglutamase [Metabacillus flavus]MBS2969157.1 formimidoylglutamase [Metabacillus flavus]
MDPFSFLQPGKAAIFKDRFVTKVNETVIPYEEGITGDTGLIGLPFSKFSISLSQASEAPQAIRSCMSLYSTFSAERNKDYRNHKILDFGDVMTHPTSLPESLKRLYISVKEMIETNSCSRYILLGGDHGISYPSIRAFSENFGTIGIIQFDAHHDVRNLEDGGRTNGTPFRSLIEEGVVEGENLVQIGIRDFSNAEAYSDYAQEKRLSIYTMGDIERSGIIPIVEKEGDRLAEKVDVIYLSLDMDAVDQAFAPGCPAIGPGGLTSRELLSAVSAAAKHEKVRAMDIVEIDPSKDFRDMTSRLAVHAMMRFMYQ